VPSSWNEYSIVWRVGTARYEISVSNPEHRCRGIAEAELDEAPVDPHAIPLVDDGRAHRVRLVLGDQRPSPARHGHVNSVAATPSGAEIQASARISP
jgi:hypothetical protein